MNTDGLDRMAGIDPADPEYRRALTMARADRHLLHELVEKRRDSGISRADVAQRLGLSEDDVAAFEQHDSDPRMSTVRRYAQVVGAEVSHLIFGPDNLDRFLSIDPADPIARLAQVLTHRDSERFAELRNIRARSGIGPQQVADALGCDVEAVYKIEQDQDCYLSQMRRYELAVLTITPNADGVS